MPCWWSKISTWPPHPPLFKLSELNYGEIRVTMIMEFNIMWLRLATDRLRSVRLAVNLVIVKSASRATSEIPWLPPADLVDTLVLLATLSTPTYAIVASVGPISTLSLVNASPAWTDAFLALTISHVLYAHPANFSQRAAATTVRRIVSIAQIQAPA